MTQKVNTILNVIESSSSVKGVPFVKLRMADGKTYSVWSDPKKPALYDEAVKLRPGVYLTLEYEVNGTFRNVRSFKEGKDASVPVEVDSHEVKVPSLDQLNGNGKSPVPYFNDRKDRRISRLACINAAIEFHKIAASTTQESCTESDILKTAVEFENWVYRGMEE